MIWKDTPWSGIRKCPQYAIVLDLDAIDGRLQAWDYEPQQIWSVLQYVTEKMLTCLLYRNGRIRKKIQK